MRSFRLLHSLPKASYSSPHRLKLETTFCQQRDKLPDYFKKLFIQNLDTITKLLPTADLRFASLVAFNFNKFGIQNDQLEDLIIHRLNEVIGDLTPSLAYELSFSLRDFAHKEDPRLYEAIFNYCKRYFYFFYPKQIKIIDGVFSGLGSNFVLSMNSLFETQDDEVTGHITEDILRLYKITVPNDELDLIIHLHQIIEIQFKRVI